MFLRTLFLLVFIVAIGDAIVYAVSGLARARVHEQQLAALRTGLSNGIALAQAAAATGTIPQPASTCAAAITQTCALNVTSTVSAASAPAPQATCPVTDCSVLLQNNTAVAESRAQFVVTANVTAANGDVIATRATTVAFRTFAQPPYASLVGSLDATLAAALASGAGDDAGNAAGTLIHVQYQGASGRVPADVWRARNESAAATSSSWDP